MSTSFEKANRTRIAKLVAGYIRIYCWYQSPDHIPDDIIDLFAKFYEDIKNDKFSNYNDDNYKLSNNDLTLTNISKSYEISTVYGQIHIPSTSETKHEWRFRIHQMSYDKGISLGIDETKSVRKEQGSLDSTSNSSTYCINLDKWEWGIWSKSMVKDGTIITMKLDLSAKTLSFAKKNKTPFNILEDIAIGEDIVYCMAACCTFLGDKIELISYGSFI